MVIIRDELVTQSRHLDEPTILGVVEQGRAAAPAERVVVRVRLHLVQQAALLQVGDDLRLDGLALHELPYHLLTDGKNLPVRSTVWCAGKPAAIPSL